MAERGWYRSATPIWIATVLALPTALPAAFAAPAPAPALAAMSAPDGVTAESPPGRPSGRKPDADPCGTVPDRSRWVPSAGERLVLAGTYRGGEGTPLASASAAGFGAGGRLVVYDSRQGRIVTLARDLTDAEKLAGRDAGVRTVAPMMLRLLRIDWLEVTDERVFVFGGRGILSFDTTGRAGDTVSLAGPLADHRWTSVRDFAAVDAGFLVAVDTRLRGGRTRESRLQTWRVGGGGVATREFHVSLPRLPESSMGSAFQGEAQAKPLWDVWNGCVVVSDGASRNLIVAAIGGGGRDTLRLPDVPPPEPGDETGEPADREQRLFGDEPPPTSRSRWARMEVDPDGRVWLLPRRQAGGGDDRTGGIRTVVVDLDSGEARMLEIPVFPRAFGRAGELYALDRYGSGPRPRRPPLVERYRLRPAE